jgi:hypothetical protein
LKETGLLMLRRTRWLFISLALLSLAGCSAADQLGLKIDLSQLNWQTGALIGLAYLANSKGHFATIAQMLLKVARGAHLLPQPDDKQSLSAEQIAKLLADLFVQLKGQPELQQQVLTMMGVAAGSVSARASEKLNG